MCIRPGEETAALMVLWIRVGPEAPPRLARLPVPAGKAYLTSTVGGWEPEAPPRPESIALQLRQAAAAAAASGNTLGTRLTGVSPQRCASPTSSSWWDAAETLLAASTDSSEAQTRAKSSVLWALIAPPLQPFFPPPCLAACQTEIQGCYRTPLAAKTASAPFFQGNGGWQPNKKRTTLSVSRTFQKSAFCYYLFQMWGYWQLSRNILQNVSFIIYRWSKYKLIYFLCVDDIIIWYYDIIISSGISSSICHLHL